MPRPWWCGCPGSPDEERLRLLEPRAHSLSGFGAQRTGAVGSGLAPGPAGALALPAFGRRGGAGLDGGQHG